MPKMNKNKKLIKIINFEITKILMKKNLKFWLIINNNLMNKLKYIRK